MLVDWPFAPLAPRDDVRLRVRVTGSDGVTSDWSEPLRIRAGFLAEGEWVAAPIGLAAPAAEAQPGLARTEFEIAGEVASAVLYATGLGVYQASVNGADVDDQVLKPGWTPYQWRLIHETTDVTDLLVAGTQRAGDPFRRRVGHRAVRLPRAGRTLLHRPAHRGGSAGDHVRGRPPAGGGHRRGLADLAPDRSPPAGSTTGRTTTLGSRTGLGPPGLRRRRLVRGRPSPTRSSRRGARTSPVVRRIEELPVQEVITTPSGRTVLDFGQNLVGRLRLPSTVRPAP